MHKCENATADRLRRVFAGISEGERLFAAEAKARNEAANHEPKHGRRECAKNCEDAEQQQIELVDGLSSPAVAEFTLASGADKHSEHGRAANQAGLGAGGEFGLNHVGDQ